MPLVDVMPVATWRDLRTVLVHTPSPSDQTLAGLLVTQRKWKSVQSFKHLRGAVEFLFKTVEFPHKRVVFPKFICGSVIRAAERAGMKVTLCDVDMKTGSISADALAKIPLDKFGAVFVVHPFGVPAEIERISELCKKHNVFLIEDCAHVFDQIVDQKSVGVWGDFALFHFAKKLPNVHGGLLISYTTKLQKLESKKTKPTLNELFSFFLKLAIWRLPLNLIRSMTKLSEDHDEGCDDHYSVAKPASDASKRLFERKLKQFRKDKHLRSKIYEAYFEFLPDDFTPLVKNIPGDLFHFPVLVPGNKNRDKILKKMRTFNMFGDRVWYTADTPFAEQLLLLPVNNFMSVKHVKQICKLLANV